MKKTFSILLILIILFLAGSSAFAESAPFAITNQVYAGVGQTFFIDIHLDHDVRMLTFDIQYDEMSLEFCGIEPEPDGHHLAVAEIVTTDQEYLVFRIVQTAVDQDMISRSMVPAATICFRLLNNHDLKMDYSLAVIGYDNNSFVIYDEPVTNVGYLSQSVYFPIGSK